MIKQIVTENNQDKVEGRQPIGKLLFDINEASFQLSMAPITVRRLVARGLLHPQPNVRKLLFSGTELQRFATA